MGIGSPDIDVADEQPSTPPPADSWPDGPPPDVTPPPAGAVVVGQTAQAIVPEAVDWAAELAEVTTVPVVEVSREVDGRGRIVFAQPVPETVAQAVRRVLLDDILPTVVAEVPPGGDTTPTEPPATSPTLTVRGAIGGLAIRLGEVADQTEAVDVWVSATSPVDTTAAPAASAPGLTGALVVVRRVVTEGVDEDGQPVTVESPVQAGSTYYVVARARNAAGSAAVSAEVSGSPDQVDTADLAVGALTADMLTANEALIDALNASDLTAVTIVGSTIRTSSQQQRGVVIDQALTVYNAVGDLFLIADPAANEMFVSGTGKFTTVTVRDGASIGGESEVPTNGRFAIRAATASPKGAPAVATSYSTTQFLNDGFWGERRGWETDGTYWYTTRLLKGPSGDTLGAIERWSPDGTNPIRNLFKGDFRLPCGVAIVDGYLVAAFDLPGEHFGNPNGRVITGWWKPLSNFADSSSAATGRIASFLADRNGPVVLGRNAASDRLILAAYSSSNDGVRVDPYSFNNDKSGFSFAGNNLFTPTSLGGDPAGAVETSVGMPAARVVVSIFGSAPFRAFTRTSASSANGTEHAADQFPAAASKRGFCHDGTRFHQIGSTGLMYSYTDEPGRTLYVSSTFARGGSATQAPTAETPQSPRARFVVPKRAGLTVTASAVPPGEGATSPDRVRIYAAPATGDGVDPGRAAMRLQSAPAPGVVTQRYTAIGTTGAVPPEVSSFVGGNPGAWSADGGGFRVDGNSDGSVGTGGFRDSVRAAARGDGSNPINLAPGFVAYAADNPPYAQVRSGWTFTGASVQRTSGNFIKNTEYTIGQIAADRAPLGGLRFVVRTNVTSPTPVNADLLILTDGTIRVRPLEDNCVFIHLTAAFPNRA